MSVDSTSSKSMNKASYDKKYSVVLRYPDPSHFGYASVSSTSDELTRVIETYDVDSILTLNEDSCLETLKIATDTSGLDVPVWPIVPNMSRFVREVTERGVVASQISRFSKLGVRSQMGLMLRYLPKVLRLARNDFVAGLLLLVEMEITRFKSHNIGCVVLGSQITELALAFENRRLLTEFFDLVQNRYRVPVGLMTSNLELLYTRLNAWHLNADVIVTPFNLKGYGMNPSLNKVVDTARTIQSRIVALNINANGTIPDSEALDYLDKNGVKTYVVSPF